MFCTACGQEIDRDSRFCRHCGAPQNEDAQSASLSRAEPARVPEEMPEPGTATSGTGRTIGIALVALIGIAGIASLTDKGAPPANQNQMAGTTIDSMSDNMTAIDGLDNMVPPQPAEPRDETWSYTTDEDKVRGAITYFARTASVNSISQAAPYDSNTTMSMTVRKSPAHGNDVILTISSGQMMCPSYEGCSGTVRFDDRTPERITFSGPADNSSETIFVDGAKAFVAKLRKSRKVIVEKTLYQAGNPQFEFNVSGLKWDH